MMDEIILGNRIRAITIKGGYHSMIGECWVCDDNRCYRIHALEFMKLLNDKVVFVKIKKRKHIWLELLTDKRKKSRK